MHGRLARLGHISACPRGTYSLVRDRRLERRRQQLVASRLRCAHLRLGLSLLRKSGLNDDLAPCEQRLPRSGLSLEARYELLLR